MTINTFVALHARYFRRRKQIIIPRVPDKSGDARQAILITVVYDIMLPAVLAVFHCFWWYFFRSGSEKVNALMLRDLTAEYKCAYLFNKLKH